MYKTIERKLNEFLENEAAIKHIFEYIKNLLLSATLYVTGVFVQPKNFPESSYPWFVTWSGHFLSALAIGLVVLCTLHVMTLLTNWLNHKLNFLIIMVLSAPIAVLVATLLAALSKAKGLTS